MQRAATRPEQRNILIQGASRGIGLEMVRQLDSRAASGQIFASCRAPERALELQQLTAASARITALPLDVADETSIRSAAERVAASVDRLDLLVNCAGLLHQDEQQPERRLQDVAASHLSSSFQVNAFGPLLVAKHFQPLLGESQQATFASISARVGSISDNRLGGWYSYRASKAAQNMFTKTLAIEWARRTRPIICLALHPGTVATELSAPFRSRTDPSKIFTVERAVQQLLAILDSATAHDSGRFIAWDGATIPW